MADLQAKRTVDGDGGNRTRAAFPPCPEQENSPSAGVSTDSSPVSPTGETAPFAGSTQDQGNERAFPEGERRRFPSVVELVGVYVDRLAALRSRAEDSQRDAYTVAIGQLHGLGLIDDATWRAALERPRLGPNR